MTDKIRKPSKAEKAENREEKLFKSIEFLLDNCDVEPSILKKLNKMLPKKKNIKELGEPTGPIGSFILFSMEKRSGGKYSSSELSVLWANMLPEKKQEYIDVALEEKQRYLEDMIKFHGKNSEKVLRLMKKKEKDTSSPLPKPKDGSLKPGDSKKIYSEFARRYINLDGVKGKELVKKLNLNVADLVSKNLNTPDQDSSSEDDE